MRFLNTANEWLIARFGDLAPLYLIGVLGVVLIALTLPILLTRGRDPVDRLDNNAEVARSNRIPADNLDPEKPKEALRSDGGRNTHLDRFSDFLEPQSEEELSTARLKMQQAGYRSKSSVRAYHFAQFALGLGFLAIGVIFALVRSATGEISSTQLILSVGIPGGIGYYLPKYWVNRRLQARQQDISDGFPDSLDMMLVCVEAGQSLEQAIIRVSQELRTGFPVLAEEYEMVSNEMKAGKDKVQVLKDMADRCGVQDVAAFVTVLIQSTSFGTSIADALRIYAAEMRDKRVMRAEEKANVLPTKLTLGTMMFTVPPLLIILVGPSGYSIYETLLKGSL